MNDMDTDERGVMEKWSICICGYLRTTDRQTDWRERVCLLARKRMPIPQISTLEKDTYIHVQYSLLNDEYTCIGLLIRIGSGSCDRSIQSEPSFQD